MIGTPEKHEISSITDKKIQFYLSTFQKRPRKEFKTIFPAASDEAIDLLTRLLIFNPEDRITISECLKHPYFDKVRHLGPSSTESSL